MIVLEEHGDIFLSQAQSIVIGVNTVGVMGKGMAEQAKRHYPGLETAYKLACSTNVFEREGFYVYTIDSGRKIVCFPSKRHWRFPSKIEWIDASLEKLALGVVRYGITSLAIPAIGCGEGKLPWEQVYPLIKRYLGPIETPVAVYLPYPV